MHAARPVCVRRRGAVEACWLSMNHRGQGHFAAHASRTIRLRPSEIPLVLERTRCLKGPSYGPGAEHAPHHRYRRGDLRGKTEVGSPEDATCAAAPCIAGEPTCDGLRLLASARAPALALSAPAAGARWSTRQSRVFSRQRASRSRPGPAIWPVLRDHEDRAGRCAVPSRATRISAYLAHRSRRSSCRSSRRRAAVRCLAWQLHAAPSSRRRPA